MDAINKYLSPLTDIGADIWNAEETPDFPLPLKKKEAMPDGDGVADVPQQLSGESDEAAQSEQAEDSNTTELNEKQESVARGNVIEAEESEAIAPPSLESVESVQTPKTASVSEIDLSAVNQTVDAAIEKIVDNAKPPVQTSQDETDDVDEQSGATSFISTLRIVSRNDDAPVDESADNEIISSIVTDSPENAKIIHEEDPLFVAHVLAPLAKTIGSLAYHYHLTLSLETEEKELRALLGRVQAMAFNISGIFKQSGVTAIGLAPRFMYVSRPVIQQAYELYHAPLSDTYFFRLQTIVENLAHFSLRLFPQSWHVGELDAHDRLDVLEALSPVVVALGQSADEKTESLVKEVCQTLLDRVKSWSAQAEKGVYSDNARMLSRFSSIFADIYLTEVERFSNLEPQEKHIYLNTYNQAPSLPIIWDLFDKKVEMLRKISDSVGNSSIIQD